MAAFLAMFVFSVLTEVEGAELSGLLRDNLGNGLGGISMTADIHFFSTGMSTQIVAATDASGHFTMTEEGEWWVLDASATELNAKGFFSVPTTSLTVTNHPVINLTTRKLDFTHRLTGRLLDEAGAPLAGSSMRASIRENDSVFETNIVTRADGSFSMPAVPALWKICRLESPVERVFGERQVEIEVTNAEKQVTLVAPAATATISVCTSNLFGCDVVVSTEAFGTTYRLSQTGPLIWSSPTNPPLAFRVFNGIWTVAVTNSEGYGPQERGVPSVIVAVTNGVVSVALNGVSQPLQPQRFQVQRVRTVTMSGQVITNATVNRGLMPPMPPIPGASNTPGVMDLTLDEGRYELILYWNNWQVSREVLISSNTPPEMTILFPETNSGPGISGTVRIQDGSGLASHSVTMSMADGETNYSASLLTDSNGHFGVHVIPGRWLVTTYSASFMRSFSSVVVVSNQDVLVDFNVLQPVRGTPVSVNASVIGDASPASETEISLRNGLTFASTNGSQGGGFLLQPGIWEVGLSRGGYQNDPYVLFPALTWQLSPNAATNLALAAQLGSFRIEGRLRDEHGHLLQTGYASAWTSVNGTNFWASGTIASGYFSLNVFPGVWQVCASVSAYPSVGPAESTAGGMPTSMRSVSGASSGFTTPSAQWIRVTNSLARCDFVVTNVPVQSPVSLNVTIVREDGGDVRNVSVIASGAGDIQSCLSDECGMASFVVPPGLVSISASLQRDPTTHEPLVSPTVSLEVSASSNHVVFVVRHPTACITGTVLNAPAMGLQPDLTATARINGTNHVVTGCADSNGHFSLPALPGLWTVRIDDTVNNFGIQSVANQEILVPSAGQPSPVDFVLTRVPGDIREARLSPLAILPGGRIQMELRGLTALSWCLERSDDCIDWTPITLGTVVNGSCIIEDQPVTSGGASFYRTVWVR